MKQSEMHGASRHDVSEHIHQSEISLVRLGIGLLGVGYVLLQMSTSNWVFFPMWLTLLVASIVQFWSGLDFYISAWHALKQKTANMYTLIVLGTTSAYLYSLGVYLFEAYFLKWGIQVHSYFDASIFIVTFILLGNYLEFLSTQRASDAIKKLLQLRPDTAWAKKDDEQKEWKEIAVESLEVGDLVLVKAGDRIPVDGKVVVGKTDVDESMLTGESESKEKDVGGKVVGGTVNISGTIEIKITETGENTALARIIELVQKAQSTRAPVQKLVDKIASYFVPLVIVCAIATFLAWFFWGPSPQITHAFISMILVLIIACPCALGLATPLAVTIGIGRGAASGILIKNARAIELMEKVNTVIFDKTGTLTKGQSAIENFDFVPELNEILAKQEWRMPTGVKKKDFTLCLGALLEAQSSHPLSRAYIKYVKERVGNYHEIIKELTVTKSESLSGLGFKAHLEEHVLVIGSIDVMEDEKVVIAESVKELALKWFDEGKSVSFFSIDSELVAFFSLSDTIRSEAKSSITWLKKNKIQVVMLTGDNERIAKAIAARLGIQTYYANLYPDEKVQHIKKIMKKGEIVAMVGDGVNDAPSLAAANIGIAIGAGTDVALETAEVVLLSNDLLKVPLLFQLSAATIRIIYQNLAWAFGYNAILIPVAAGLLYPLWGIVINPVMAGGAMVLSSLSVVLNSLRLKNIKLRKVDD